MPDKRWRESSTPSLTWRLPQRRWCWNRLACLQTCVSGWAGGNDQSQVQREGPPGVWPADSPPQTPPPAASEVPVSFCYINKMYHISWISINIFVSGAKAKLFCGTKIGYDHFVVFCPKSGRKGEKGTKNSWNSR